MDAADVPPPLHLLDILRGHLSRYRDVWYSLRDLDDDVDLFTGEDGIPATGVLASYPSGRKLELMRWLRNIHSGVKWTETWSFEVNEKGSEELLDWELKYKPEFPGVKDEHQLQILLQRRGLEMPEDHRAKQYSAQKGGGEPPPLLRYYGVPKGRLLDCYEKTQVEKDLKSLAAKGDVVTLNVHGEYGGKYKTGSKKDVDTLVYPVEPLEHAAWDGAKTGSDKERGRDSAKRKDVRRAWQLVQLPDDEEIERALGSKKKKFAAAAPVAKKKGKGGGREFSAYNQHMKLDIAGLNEGDFK